MSETINPQELGQYLRQAREQKKISAEDMADSLRVSLSVIKKIESDLLAPQELTVYMRGYIRAYARLVNIPEQVINDYFEKAGIATKTEKSKPVKITRQISIKDKPVKVATYIIIAVLVIMVLAWWYSHQAEDNNVVNLQASSSAQPVNGDAAVATTTSITPTSTATDDGSSVVTPKEIADQVAKEQQDKNLKQDELKKISSKRPQKWVNPDNSY